MAAECQSLRFPGSFSIAVAWPVRDFNLMVEGITNPASTSQLEPRKSRAGTTMVLCFKNNTPTRFLATAIPDQPWYFPWLKYYKLPPPTDKRSVEEKMVALVNSKLITEYRTGSTFWRKAGSSKYSTMVGAMGGGVTVEPHETLNGNIEVVVGEDEVNKGNGWLDVAIQNYGITFDASIAVMHEFGHALAIADKHYPYFNVWSVETENQIRARRAQLYGDRIVRLRTSEDPKFPNPATLKPDYTLPHK